jgi:hypothetical protein
MPPWAASMLPDCSAWKAAGPDVNLISCRSTFSLASRSCAIAANIGMVGTGR